MVLISIIFRYSELSSVNENLKAKVSRYEKSLKDLDETNKRLLDEYQALELAYSSLNDKLRSLMVSLLTTRQV